MDPGDHHQPRFLARNGDFTHGVDVSFDQIMFLRLQDQIVSSEGDDPRLPAAPGNLREAVRVQASTRQDVPAPHLVALLIQAEPGEITPKLANQTQAAIFTFESLISIGYFIPAGEEKRDASQRGASDVVNRCNEAFLPSALPAGLSLDADMSLTSQSVTTSPPPSTKSLPYWRATTLQSTMPV